MILRFLGFQVRLVVVRPELPATCLSFLLPSLQEPSMNTGQTLPINIAFQGVNGVVSPATAVTIVVSDPIP